MFFRWWKVWGFTFSNSYRMFSWHFLLPSSILEKIGLLKMKKFKKKHQKWTSNHTPFFMGGESNVLIQKKSYFEKRSIQFGSCTLSGFPNSPIADKVHGGKFDLRWLKTKNMDILRICNQKFSKLKLKIYFYAQLFFVDLVILNVVKKFINILMSKYGFPQYNPILKGV